MAPVSMSHYDCRIRPADERTREKSVDSDRAAGMNRVRRATVRPLRVADFGIVVDLEVPALNGKFMIQGGGVTDLRHHLGGPEVERRRGLRGRHDHCEHSQHQVSEQKPSKHPLGPPEKNLTGKAAIPPSLAARLSALRPRR